MAEKGVGAFLGLIKGGAKKKAAPPSAGPLDDEVEGAAYSKVDEEKPEEGASSASFASLAEALGIPEENRAQAEAALKTFVKSCSGAKTEY